MAVSGLQFLPLASSSHHRHTAFLALGVLWNAPVFPRVRKRREEDRQQEKRKTGRFGCLEPKQNIRWPRGVLGILLTSAASQPEHSGHFLSVTLFTQVERVEVASVRLPSLMSHESIILNREG